MNLLSTLFVGLLAAAAPAGSATPDSTPARTPASMPAAAPDSALAFVGVSVLSMTSPELAHGQTVIVRDGRIAAIGPDLAIPPDARRIDAAGKVLLPGLADLHVHTGESELPLFLANGVTLVREMNGTPERVALRARIERGEIAGPRLFVTSPLLAGEKLRWRHRFVASPDDARVAADEAKTAGYGWLKVYDGLSRPSYEALVEASRRTGLPLDGHVPEAVGLERVLQAGQTIEHMDKIAHALSSTGSMKERLARARTLFAKHPVWVVPTVASLRALDIAGTIEYAARLEREEMRFVDGGTLGWWRSLSGTRPARPAPSDRYAFYVELLGVLRENGIELLLGTDSGNPLMVSGFAVHEELDALVHDAGLTPYDALRMATVHVGRFLNEPDVGVVRVGALADLVLADGDPLKDVAVLRRPWGVVARGRWYDRPALDRMLR